MKRHVMNKFGHALYDVEHTRRDEEGHLDIGYKKLRYVGEPEEDHESVTKGFLERFYLNKYTTVWNEIKEVKTSIDKLETSCEAITPLKTETAEIRSNLESLRTFVNTVQTTLNTQIDKNVSLKLENDSIRSTLEDLKTTVNTFQSSLNNKGEEITTLKTEIAGIRSTFQSLLNEKDEEITKLKTEIAGIRSKLSELLPLKNKIEAIENNKLPELTASLKNCLQFKKDSWFGDHRKISHVDKGVAPDDVCTLNQLDNVVTFNRNTNLFHCGGKEINIVVNDLDNPVVKVNRKYLSGLAMYGTNKEYRHKTNVYLVRGRLLAHNGANFVPGQEAIRIRNDGRQSEYLSPYPIIHHDDDDDE
jgi:regulator of replication initiation timing